MKLKSVNFVKNIGQNKKTKKLSLHQIMDNLQVYMLPTSIKGLILYLDFVDIEKEYNLDLNLKDEKGNVLFEKEIELNKNFSVKKIIKMKNMVIKEKGRISILIKDDDKVLFNMPISKISFVPAKNLSKEDKEKILESENVIKKVNIDLPFEKKEYNFQILLDNSLILDESKDKFPENNKLEIDGQIYDLTGYYNYASHLYGQKLPTKEEVAEKKAEIDAKKTMNIVIDE